MKASVRRRRIARFRRYSQVMGRRQAWSPTQTARWYRLFWRSVAAQPQNAQMQALAEVARLGLAGK